MYCTKCGNELDEGDVFCSKCGTKVVKKEVVEDSFDVINNRVNNYVSANTIYDDSYNIDNLPSQDNSLLKDFYLIDFFKRLVGKENLPLAIYLLLNVIIIGAVTTLMFNLPIYWGLVVGFLLYLGSVSIALSPIGEWLLRKQTGCIKINNREVIERIEPIFREVYYNAKKANPSISSDVRLFMNDDESPNAFATGRKTICITKGLLKMSDDEIKGTLGHEFGHLSHKDTDRILIVQVGNTIITGICIMIQVCAIICDVFCTIMGIVSGTREGFLTAILSNISRFITVTLVALFMKLWTMLGVALCMKTSRNNEYHADAFSVKLGYGKGLATMLNNLGNGKRPKGLFASLASSHPDTDDRINRILEQMEDYQNEN